MSEPAAALPSTEAHTPPISSTHPVAGRGSIAATTIAAVVGFCIWATVFGLRSAGVLEHIGEKQKSLMAQVVFATDPKYGEYIATLTAARNADAIITTVMMFSTLGFLMALGSLVYMWGIGGVRPKSLVRWVAGMILLVLLFTLAGYLSQSLFVASKVWLAPGPAKDVIDVETRFMMAEAALWAGLGLALAIFATVAYGKPAPIWKAWPGLVLMSTLVGVVATCIAMAVTMNANSLSPITGIMEIGAILGIGNAALCAILAWKATE